MIYNAKYETMNREELAQLQIERLQSTLNRVYRNVAFYRESFDRSRVDISSIKSVADMVRLPFTTKDDLRASYPYNMFAVPLRDIVRIHSTTGRTGRPIAIGYTRNDIAHWSELVARVLSAAGVTEHDFVQIAFDYNMFTGGFGLHYGAEKIGASVIPSSQSGNVQRQIHIMKDYKTTVLLSAPSYALRIAANLREMGIHPDELNLKIGIFGAEAWGEPTRSKIEERLHLDAFNIYGVNEMMGPGVSGECSEKKGLHINEDHYIIEIVDPATGNPLPHGEEGELVITTITREGFPLIRYRTGDMSSIMEGTCACGRTTLRMNRVSARSDDMVAVNGINVFPGQVCEVLKKETGFEPRYQIIIDEFEGGDSLEVRIEMIENMFGDEIKKILGLKTGIAAALEREIGVTARVTFVEPMALHKTPDGRVRRVVDNR
ncbi:MAG TPA: phenylacetate--CoA ligase [Spirochaetota bacterium]|nr:phenylacetate--CoA ligase [Spirochaetota bacterium]HSA15992.1 phenylacetate--CoA ligase [Spirochaetota bacterium]